MIRDRRLLLLSLLLGFASQPPNGLAQPAPQFVPAPVPNPDVRPPRAAGGGETDVAPHLFMPPDRFAGDGYTPGSSVQTEQERHLRPGAGVNLRMTFE